MHVISGKMGEAMYKLVLKGPFGGHDSRQKAVG